MQTQCLPGAPVPTARVQDQQAASLCLSGSRWRTRWRRRSPKRRRRRLRSNLVGSSSICSSEDVVSCPENNSSPGISVFSGSCWSCTVYLSRAALHHVFTLGSKIKDRVVLTPRRIKNQDAWRVLKGISFIGSRPDLCMHTTCICTYVHIRAYMHICACRKLIVFHCVQR